MGLKWNRYPAIALPQLRVLFLSTQSCAHIQASTPIFELGSRSALLRNSEFEENAEQDPTKIVIIPLISPIPLIMHT